MAIVYDGPVLPDDLTTFVREVPTPASHMLDQILPNVFIQSNEVDLGAITRRNRTARFRAYDSNLHVAQRDTATLTRVQLPPLSDTLQVGELERLKLEFARTGGTNQSAFVDAIYNDAETLTRYTQNRMEQARGDVLTDGKFTLTGEGGLTLEADYGVPAGNFVAPATLWSVTATADIIGDISTWVRDYRALNGYSPGGMWISQSVLIAMLGNVALRTASGSILGVASQLTRAALDASLSAYSLPPIAGVYDTVVDVDGAVTRITPEDRVIFVPPAGQPFGRTVWGITATALELVNSPQAALSFSQAAGIVGVVDKVGPPYREFTFVDAVGMPVIDDPNALMVAKVL